LKFICTAFSSRVVLAVSSTGVGSVEAESVPGR